MRILSPCCHWWLNNAAFAGLAGILFCAGCATTSYRLPIPTVPVQPGTMAIGVNAGFEGGESPAVIDRICTWGSPIVRASVGDASQVAAILQSFSACPSIRVLLLVEHTDAFLVSQLPPLLTPQVWGIELGNEIDLEPVTAEGFGGFVANSARQLRAAGFMGTIWSGGISSVRPEKLAWLRTAMAAGWPPDVGVAIHRYSQDGGPVKPQRGHRSRDAEWAAVKEVVGPRQWAVTESGYVNDGRDEQLLANYLSEDLRQAQSAGAVAFVMYQIHDGPSSQSIDRFGLHDISGRYRPAAEVLRQWGRRQGPT